MKSIVFSTLYPNSAQPRHGIFLEHRVCNISDDGRTEVRVVAPVPWLPFSGHIFPAYKKYGLAPLYDTRRGVDIVYPRYPVIPKIGMTLTPLSLAAASIRPMRALIRGGYDFDLIDSYYFYPDGVAAALLGRYFHKPVLITAFGTDINLIPQFAIPRAMIRWASRQAAEMTSVCQALKDEMVELGIQENRIEVILHGVDLELFKPPSDREALRVRLGLARPTLLSVGHLIERKGHHLVIEALAKLPDAELLIAGDGEEEANLRRLAESLRVVDRVRFLGHVDQADLPNYYGASDALVLASSREGIANVLLESMACGTPVVATNVWGAPEVITVPESGVLTGVRSSQALVDCIQRLLTNYPSRAATRRYVEQYSWKKTADRNIELYERVLARGKNG